MAEETLENNENDEVVSVSEQVEPVEEVNPFFDYLQKAFNKEKSDEYLGSLSEEQKNFLFAFVSGYQSAIGYNNIVGVYDFDYIDGFHFTPEILKTVNVVTRPVEVTDLEMKFVLVVQYN